MFLQKLIPSKGIAFAAGLLSLSLASCDSSFVFEDLRECVPEYRVRLSYTHNLDYEERASQIEAAEVYAFDAEGKLAAVSTADRQTLIDNDWTLPLAVDRFQDYDLVVWGGLTSESPFHLPATRAVNAKEDLACLLRTEDVDGTTTSSKHFPGLFHGVTRVNYSVEDGPEERTVPMMKNTNDIHVLIQKENGDPMEPEYYDVEIYDSNGEMDHANNVSGEEIQYNHHTFTIDDFQIPNGLGGKEETYVSSGKWDFSVARLMESSDARIQIRLDNSNIVLINEPLMPLLIASKRMQTMSNQEYLDRQDTYYLTFRLRVEEDWIHISVYVNDWLIIKNDIEWGTN